MDDAELLVRADLNLIEFNREGARSTAGGIVHEEDGLVFFAPGHRFPVGFTGVMRTDVCVTATDVVARTRAFFRDRGHGYTFIAMMHRDDDLAALLESEGVGRFGNSPGMACDKRLDDKPLPAGASIERVHGGDGARAFAAVSASAYATYGMPPDVATKQFADHRFFELPQVAAFIARLDGTPAAAAMVLVSHGVAGIYWVGTTPEARGRGLAEACTRAATNAGFDMGAKFAALQASVMGEPIYLRMGYREITRYPWFTEIP
ncbi:MAG TPA: GNAT family N-acetyltransferase [Candidatus Binatia bacterium]|jgi:ribosomal protein S18 acetylase RimI-like enzyme